MNKSDLIKSISFQLSSVKKNDIEESVNQLIDVISDSIMIFNGKSGIYGNVKNSWKFQKSEK